LSCLQQRFSMFWRSNGGDQLAALVVGDSPGAGGRRRTMIVLDLDDFVQWFGKEQPSTEQAVVKRTIETRSR
jgi:hypothetical protein